MLSGWQLAVGLRGDGGDDAVFDGDDGLLDDVIRREEATRSEDRSHRTEYSERVSLENSETGWSMEQERRLPELCGSEERCGRVRDRIGARIGLANPGLREQAQKLARQDELPRRLRCRCRAGPERAARRLRA